jgi:thiol-disulfide isomerase/thioredoxin
MKKTAVSLTLTLGLAVLAGCNDCPPSVAADPSAPLTNSAPIDFAAELAHAKAQNKLVLLDFTGSDWCPPCMELHKTILTQPEFLNYAKSNLIFLTVDFPKKVKLPPATAATNEFLAEKFEVEGFPTLILVNGDGKVVWQNLGLPDGGPGEVVAQIEAAKKRRG